MWYRSALRLGAAGLCAASAWWALQACAVDQSGDPALLTVKVDTAAKHFDSIYVILKDAQGSDTLWRDSLKDPSQLAHLPTKGYHGQEAVILVQGWKGGAIVYEEKRTFDPAKSALAPRDTLKDLSAAITAFAWSAREILLPFGDSSHYATLGVLPAKADARAAIRLSDSTLFAVRDSGTSAQGGRRYRILARKSGIGWIIATSLARPDLIDSISVRISVGTNTVPQPMSRTNKWTRNVTPTWTWTRGGTGGIGFYNVRLDSDSLAGEIVGDTEWTAKTALPDGPHTLYVREEDGDGQFSPPIGIALIVDTQAPAAPKVSNASLSATYDPHPAWSWIRQGDGAGHFRVKLDDSDLSVGATPVDSLRFTAKDSLPVGAHTLRVQEQDSAGNWSLSGSATVTVVLPDRTPPGKPLPVGPQGILIPTHEKLTWRSGGPDGSGVYRYLIDKSDFAKDSPTETNDSVLALPPNLDTGLAKHTLRVQERDSVGNWSEAAEFGFTAYHFTFIRSKIDTELVLTVAPDSVHLRLSRRVKTPKNDSEAALQRLQLWYRTKDSRVSDAEQWRSQFVRRDLKQNGFGQLITLAGFTGVNIDSTKLWKMERLPFVGGTPPEEYLIKALGTDLRLNVQGDTWTEASPIILWEQGHFDPNELWKFQTYLDKWFID